MQAENFTLFTQPVGGNKFRPTVEIQSPRLSSGEIHFAYRGYAMQA